MTAPELAKSLAGSLLMVAIDGPKLTPSEKAFLSEKQPCGVILFKRNIKSQNQVISLIQEIQSTRTSPWPILMGVDQEGGRVSRMDFVPNLGPPLKLFPGTHEEPLEKLYQYGKDLGHALKELGFHINFAPVLDVLTEETNTAIGDRVFGTTPEEVSLRAGSFLDGLQWSGIHGCLKHFPGQGDAKGDTHETSISIPLDLETLQRRELQPFQALAQKCQLVMISHCVYPEISAEPASLSKEIQQNILRERLGFNGLIVSDDMNMGAVPQSECEFQSSLQKAILAGTDLLLVCQNIEKAEIAWQGMFDRLLNEPDFGRIIDRKSQRITSLRKSVASQS